MSAWRPRLVLSAVLLLLVAALAWLFQLRLGGGEVYPLYSSHRNDALGTGAWYEALAQQPGLRVERTYRSLAQLEPGARLVLLPGLVWREWEERPENELRALKASLQSGARVVLAFRAELQSDAADAEPALFERKKDPTGKKIRPDAKDAKPGKEPKKKAPKPPGVVVQEKRKLAQEFGVTLKQRWILTKVPGAWHTPQADAPLPEKLPWQSDVHFTLAAGSGWKTLYRRGGEAVLIERAVGRGTLVLIADSFCLSNEAMFRDRATGLLAWLVGAETRVVFLEGSLGVLEKNGLGHLARRYGLGGALALCGLLGVLYAWRRLIAFRPLAQDARPDGEIVLRHEPAAGFTNLLRRSLGPAEILPACLAEWRKVRGAGGANAAAARVEAAWLARDQKQSISSTYNALVRALKPR